jgi:hypothetical protein
VSNIVVRVLLYTCCLLLLSKLQVNTDTSGFGTKLVYTHGA